MTDFRQASERGEPEASLPHIGGPNPARPLYDLPRTPMWTDDDVAQISLGGCMSIVFLSILWLGIYAVVAIDFNAEFFTELAEGRGQQSGTLLIGMLAASIIAFMGSAYLFGVRRHPLGWEAAGLRATSAAWVWGSVLLGLLFVPVNVFIVFTVQRGLNMPEIELGDMGFGTFPLLEFVAVFVLAAIIIPIAEEIFFRGVIYQWLRVRAGFIIALIVSSAIFGVLHQYIPSIASISVLGALCAIVYERSGSLWPAIIVHATNNAVAIVLSYLVLSTRLPF